MKLLDYLRNPMEIVVWFMTKPAKKVVSDRLFIKIKYRARTGKKLNLKMPQSFNEKLQWLKLYDHEDVYTTMVDKYEVKKYISDAIGKEYVIPTLGVYEKFDEIDFDKLPNQFVIKCTHDSGGLVVCKNKATINKDECKLKITKCLNRSFFYSGREWPYKNVKPRIIIEKYIEDKGKKELRDYKFFCFNGRVRFFKIDFNRFTKHQANYFDKKGKLLAFGEEVCPPDFSKRLSMPHNLKTMIELAEKLSEGIPFLRVDFYEANDKVYFGELTFFPASGFGNFIPDEWDRKIGDYLKLPNNKGGKQ